MKRQNYNATIKAPKEKVWDTLWGKESYKQWTAAFAEGSDAITDWKEGSKVIFTDGKGKDGMVARIAKKTDYKYLSLQHLGILKDGKEITEGPDVEGWAGAEENYTLTEKDGNTRLDVDIDLSDKRLDYFNKTWPKALEKLKDLAES